MRAYIAYIRMSLRLTARERLVIFFNYLFPLVFLVGFGEFMNAAQSPGAAAQVFALVLTLNILGTGFFGAGMRAVVDRETGILRRFKVAPLTPGPILVASIVVGWIVFLPALAIFVALLHWRYGMPLPANPMSLILFLSLGVIAFRAMGMIIGAVVNSMQESQIIVQLLYLPMLMLSGATIPLELLPDWLQVVAQYIPSTHLTLGMKGILLRGESLAQNSQAVFGLLATSVVCLFVSYKLFRWEKEEKLKPTAKLWVVASLVPFVVMGVYQTYDRGNLKRTQMLARASRRAQNYLIRDARIFTGERVIERGALLFRHGRIEKIYDGDAPSAKELGAEEVMAVGKTVLPGLIDGGVVLPLEAGMPPANATGMMATAERALGAYLYSGVTTVGSVGVPDQVRKMVESRFASGEKVGSSVVSIKELPHGCRATQLSFYEASADHAAGNLELLKGSLVAQVTPRDVLQRIEQFNAKPASADARIPSLDAGVQQLLNAQKSGTKLVATTLSGTALLVHGPMLHHELAALVKAGLTPTDALRTATTNAADCLGIGATAGRVAEGREATVVVVEGNPLEEISATARVTSVFYKGEWVNRGALIEKK